MGFAIHTQFGPYRFLGFVYIKKGRHSRRPSSHGNSYHPVNISNVLKFVNKAVTHVFLVGLKEGN